jgi:serine/threonine-protein kinase HipA
MTRTPAHPPLDIYLNGKLLGHFRRVPSGAIRFTYAAAWLAWDAAIPVSLSLPLREDPYTGPPVFAVFDNLLPDDAHIRRTIAERTGAQGADPYSLLAAIGRDCVGALQFLPHGARPPDPARIDSRPLTGSRIANILANLAQNPLGLGRDHAFRISLAGAQEKTALLRFNNRWRLPAGATPTTHILKPQLGVLPNGLDMSHSVENEHFCMSLARAFGLPAAHTRLLDVAGRRVLAIERFDRFWTRDKRLLRIPQEDMCQALSVPPSRKYQADGGPTIRQILHLLQGSDAPEQDRRTFLKAQLFFWLIGATDGHAKNFSVRLGPGGRFRLTPLYDILSLQPAFHARQIEKKNFRLAMSVGDNRHYAIDSITPRHFQQEAEAAGLPARSIDQIMKELLDAAPNAIANATRSAPADPRTVNSILAGLRTRLKLLETAAPMKAYGLRLSPRTKRTARPARARPTNQSRH